MRKPLQLDLLNKPSGRTAIITASGFVFDLANPDASGLPVEDVARALAAQPRWMGATRTVYSVAEHSVFVSHLVPRAHAYDGLWHDGVEFLTGDWPSPVKEYLGRALIKRLLQPLENALAREFGFRVDVAAVKHYDLVAMATERRDLLPPAWMDWEHLPDPTPEPIRPVGPDRAFDLFMERYEALKHLALPPEKGSRR